MRKNVRNRVLFLSIILVYITSISYSCNSSEDNEHENISEPNLLVSTIEEGASIYIDGVYTGKKTPAEFLVSKGEYTVGVGLNNTKRYLRKKIKVTSSTDVLVVSLDENDFQEPKTWKVLFVGVNKVTTAGGNCVSEYTTEQLDLAYDFLKWSFEEKVEPYSYNTINWEFERRDITTDIVQLSSDNLITPNIFESQITDIQKGDYDLVATFFRGVQQDCFIADFIGIAWFDVTELFSETSYYTIRYYNDLEGAITYSKRNNPGMFIHEWLHTIAERFYPDRGWTMPSFKRASSSCRRALWIFSTVDDLVSGYYFRTGKRRSWICRNRSRSILGMYS